MQLRFQQDYSMIDSPASVCLLLSSSPRNILADINIKFLLRQNDIITVSGIG